MSRTLTTPNRYPAACIRCRGRIPAGEGLLARDDNDRWAADHIGECPPKPMNIATPQPVAKVQQDGIYRTADGTIYKVQIAKQGSGNLYAKRLDVTECASGPHCPHPTITDENGTHFHGHFTYAAGAIHTLRADQRLNDTDARAFGKLYGICCACGADLTDETSIANGIGPICGRKYF